jgi:hypothetical protein
MYLMIEAEPASKTLCVFLTKKWDDGYASLITHVHHKILDRIGCLQLSPYNFTLSSYHT